MDEIDRKAEAVVQEVLAEAVEQAVRKFDVAVAKSESDLKKRIVEVTGIENGDDNALVVGRVTFGPEKKGMMPNHRGEGCVRTPTGQPGPLNQPRPELDREILEDIMDTLKDGHVPTPPKPEGTPAPAREETLGQGADGGGKRLNAGKNRIELLPPEWLWALADVMTQGSRKYDARNWEKGMDWSSMIGCMHRHIAKFQAGKRYDGEGFNLEKGTTGCHELAMVAWNALALMSYDLRNKGNNDLPDDDGLKLFDQVNAMTTDKGNNIHED